jgi:hypothetical protein
MSTVARDASNCCWCVFVPPSKEYWAGGDNSPRNWTKHAPSERERNAHYLSDWILSGDARNLIFAGDATMTNHMSSDDVVVSIISNAIRHTRTLRRLSCYHPLPAWLVAALMDNQFICFVNIDGPVKDLPLALVQHLEQNLQRLRCSLKVRALDHVSRLPVDRDALKKIIPTHLAQDVSPSPYCSFASIFTQHE